MLEAGNIAPHRIQKLAGLVFISCLIILFLSGFDAIKAKARDIKRRSDIKILVKALDLYHDQYGKYPDSINDWQGWDLSIGYNSGDPDFLAKLQSAGLIDRIVKDPINDAAYHYRYEKFQKGDYGCANSFYILQAINFELPAKDNGRGQCPGFNWAESAPNGYTAQDFD